MRAFVTFMLFFLIIAYLIFITNTNKVEGFENQCTEGRTKGRTKGCTSNKLLPILNPKFNLREISKNCILLEDHLFQKGKRCEDCIKKHMLTIEALAEEAITLDKKKECTDYYNLPDKIRDVQKEYIDGNDPHDIAQKVREIRKTMMVKCFGEFK